MDKVENAKDTKAVTEDNSLNYLSLVGESVVKGAAAGIAGSVLALKDSDAVQTAGKIGYAAAEALTFGAIGAGVGAGAGVALKAARELAQPAKEVAVGAGVAAGIGAKVAAEAVFNKDAASVARDMAIGAAIGGAVGACTGDATRSIAMAGMGAIAAAAARAAECCKPCPSTMIQEIGRDTWNHMKNRPGEALIEGALFGPAGVIGGAAAHKFMKANEKVQPVNMPKVEEKSILDHIKDFKYIPVISPVISPIPLNDIGKYVGTGPVIDHEKAAAVIKVAANEANNAITEHRKENPTASTLERTAGYVIGGPIAGKVVGGAIELGDVGARKAAKWVKSFFE